MKKIFAVLLYVAVAAGLQGLVALLCPVSSAAQDFITMRDGRSIEATDVIFGPSRISYRLYSDPTGPMLFIDTAEVEAIYYENGEKQVVHNRRAELRPGMRYADIKDLYDYKAYTPQPGDRYNPSLMGLASVIPGLGQCLEGEWGTGVLLFLGDAACWYTAFQTLKVRDDILEDGTAVHSVKPTIGTVFFAGCALAIIGFSVFDATRIARVKNMYLQDLRRRTSACASSVGAATLRVEPFLATTSSSTLSDSPSVAVSGLTLRISF